MAALDSGESSYNNDVLDTVGELEAANTKTDWQRINTHADAIVKMQAKMGTALDGNKPNLATRLMVGVNADGKLESPTGTDLDTRLAVRIATDGNIAQVDAEHDTDGKHIFKLPHYFYQDNVVASQTAVTIPIAGPASGIEFEMPWDGSIVGISAQVANAEARTAGTLTVDATINGVPTGFRAYLTDINPEHHSDTQAISLDVFSAGDRIGVKVTTDAGWLPTSADVSVVVYVSFN